MRAAAERGHLVIGMGDFNMVPLSLAHRIIETHAPVRDVWRIIHPDSSHGAAKDKAEMLRGLPMPNAEFNLSTNGTTCDSAFNSWRWNEAHKKQLKKGENVQIDPTVDDPSAKRLDYVFFGSARHHDPNTGEHVDEWELKEANVGMTMRHPTLHCSLSDHFSVECTLTRRPNAQGVLSSDTIDRYLPTATYEEIMATLVKYMDRQRLQRKLRIGHFFFQLSVWTACLIGVWWSPHNYVSFILMLLSSIGLSVGVIDGLMGLLFGGSEMRALKEFQWEVKNAMDRALDVEVVKEPAV
jgi:sphingomyelin phosphodiesterase 2